MSERYRDSPESLEAKLLQITHTSLSTPARIAHIGLLLLSTAMAIVMISLLMTETVILRTQIAFWIMLFIAVAWASYATWVLKVRSPLLANHRVIAGYMSVTFTAILVAASVLGAFLTNKASLYWGTGLGMVMFAVSLGLLIKAKTHFSTLSARRKLLEENLKKWRD